jgi:predicted RNA binding protein YcfA (HicA-like mRNA interferase family)
MFTVYKKIVSPESSPVLGPVPDANNAIEPFALCNYCCSNRNKPQPGNTVPENTVPGHPEQNPVTVPGHPEQNPVTVPGHPEQNPVTVPLHPGQKMQQSKYEFGHATHYVYGVTSPRLLCEFETGTIP